VSPWIQYTLLRLGLFAAALGVLLALQLDWWWAAIIATVIAMTVSYIFFGKLRDAVALDLAARREKPVVDPDGEAEDAVAGEPGSTPAP
jgi:membrane protein implicated in regulation of membrane protease activity